ncbi:MAG: NAD(P)-dependent oxidoreductase [Clostridiales bacterium]|nr:NAD(P)-dependent oxidoreductase [Clostridiales bacterium]
MAKKTVMLTGSSGNMGFAGFKELYAKKDQFNIVLLNRGSEKNREKFKAYENDPSVRLVWGDLTNYEDVLNAVNGADYVLHVGGMVSPAADYYPKKTIVTNTTAARNIVNAVKAQPDPDAVKVVYIGTVAETGERDDPIHWARTGDPVKISIYDHYATSKVLAESYFAESGLKHWVSLRQSGILYGAILKNMEPIMYHVPVNGVLEWATVEDSGRLLANVCGDDIPEDFWRKFYNIGSGKEYRITNLEFEEYLLGTLGIGSPKKLFDPDWFTLRNFHGQWYLDSDELERYCHFRANVPIDEYFKGLLKNVEFYYRLAFLAKPFAFAIKPFMKKIGQTPVYGTLWWRENKVKERISAYYGSEEKWNAIGKSWDNFKCYRPEDDPSKVLVLDHGYDESKPVDTLTLDDLKKAAQFRGGECLATEEEYVDFYTPIKWKCAHGHEFMMSPNLVLRGGHWCPKELPSDEKGEKFHWAYDKEAKLNPFFAQVWYPLHDKDEDNEYDESIFKDFGKNK